MPDPIKAPEPLYERHYISPNSTKNLPGVAQEIPPEIYKRVAERIGMLGEVQGRAIGIVEDRTEYYFFKGSNVFLRNGLAQVGRAATTDNQKGFCMIRLFANSADEIGDLEREVNLHE